MPFSGAVGVDGFFGSGFWFLGVAFRVPPVSLFCARPPLSRESLYILVHLLHLSSGDSPRSDVA